MKVSLGSKPSLNNLALIVVVLSIFSSVPVFQAVDSSVGSVPSKVYLNTASLSGTSNLISLGSKMTSYLIVVDSPARVIWIGISIFGFDSSFHLIGNPIAAPSPAPTTRPETIRNHFK